MTNELDPNLPEDYKKIITEFRNVASEYEFNKKEYVNKAAKSLDKAGFDKEKISTQLTKDLQGFQISKNYIRQCLDAEYKDQSKVRANPNKIAVAAGTNETVSEGTRVDTNTAKEDYEKNKYARLAEKAGKSVGKSVSLAQANAEVENPTNTRQTELIGSYAKQVKELNSTVAHLREEIEMNTKVSLNKDMFDKVQKYISDSKVNRIIITFSRENMEAINIQAIVK